MSITKYRLEQIIAGTEAGEPQQLKPGELASMARELAERRKLMERRRVGRLEIYGSSVSQIMDELSIVCGSCSRSSGIDVGKDAPQLEEYRCKCGEILARRASEAEA